MKNLLFIFTLLVCFFPLNAQENIKQAHIEFEETVFDFGDIAYGADAVHEFLFKNTGKATLELTKVKASCGCTTPTYSNEPIKKRKSGSITVKYNTKIKGRFQKSITVESNADNSRVVLMIKGNVLAKAD